jgi:Rrf2 family protein
MGAVSALLSKPSQHAIRALIYLSRLRASDSATVQTIAEAANISQPFLAKTIRRLVAAGLLESFRGPGGGIRLARPPHKITVLEVIDILDPDGVVVEGCVLGLDECGGPHPCPMHERWSEIREQLRKGLENTTIAGLSTTLDKRGVRLG